MSQQQTEAPPAVRVSTLDHGRETVHIYTDGDHPMWGAAAASWARALMVDAIEAEKQWTTALWRDRPDDDTGPSSPLTRRANATRAAAEDFFTALAEQGAEAVVRNLLDAWGDAR